MFTIGITGMPNTTTNKSAQSNLGRGPGRGGVTHGAGGGQHA